MAARQKETWFSFVRFADAPHPSPPPQSPEAAGGRQGGREFRRHDNHLRLPT